MDRASMYAKKSPMWIYPFNNLKNVCQNARIKLTNNATIKEANFTPRLTHEKCMKKST